MNEFDSITPPGGKRFNTTAWTLISNAKKGDESEKKHALERLLSIYWRPVYWEIRLDWNENREEAKDTTQDYFSVFLEKEMIGDVERAKGRFRAYVKATLKNFMLSRKRARQAAKRGGGRKIIALDDLEKVESACTANEDPAEKRFDRELMRSIIEESMKELGRVCTQAGKKDHFELFETYYMGESEGESVRYEDLQERFQMTYSDVKHRLREMRGQFREIMVSFLRDGLSSEDELLAEIREVFEA
jgi:RNA polymerase sigma-70 factor (ECF subfamily)